MLHMDTTPSATPPPSVWYYLRIMTRNDRRTMDDWTRERLDHLKGLKRRSDQQELLLLLADKPDRTADEDKQLRAIVRAEKAADRAQRAKVKAQTVIDQRKRAERKARDRELYQSAGLLILARLVDTKTGTPTADRGLLLGALASLADSLQSDKLPEDKRKKWKSHGDAILAKDP